MVMDGGLTIFHFVFAHFKELSKGFIIENLPVKSTLMIHILLKGKTQLLFRRN